MKKQNIGDPFLEESTVGPMIDISSRDKLKNQVLSSIKKGEFTKIISVTGGSLILKTDLDFHLFGQLMDDHSPHH